MEDFDSSDMPMPTSRVSLRIFSPELNPDLVTQTLNLTPDRSHHIGDYIDKSKRATYKHGMWGIHSKLSKEESFAAHLENLLLILEPRQEEILKLGEDHTVDFYCGLFSHIGFDLSPDILKRIANLGATLSVCIYP